MEATCFGEASTAMAPQPAALASCLGLQGDGEQRWGTESGVKGICTCSSPRSVQLPRHLVGTGRRDTHVFSFPFLPECLGITPALPLLLGGTGCQDASVPERKMFMLESLLTSQMSILSGEGWTQRHSWTGSMAPEGKSTEEGFRSPGF